MTKLIAIIVSLLTTPLFAVTTSHWTQTNEADFKAGKFHNVVATNLGDVKLSREVKTLLDQDPKVGRYTRCLRQKMERSTRARGRRVCCFRSRIRR